MASSTVSPTGFSPKETLSPISGVLSYLVPGLGQMLQGRIAKGLLFFVCIYTLFFYGMWLGTTTVTLGDRTYHVVGNVYLPHAEEDRPADRSLPTVLYNLYARPQFAGQFFVGVAAWPAIAQYVHFKRTEVEAIDRQIDDLYSDLNSAVNNNGDNVGELQQKIKEEEHRPQYRHPYFGDFMREPNAIAINVVTNAGDKRLELAWVFTVIAGVLNIMVIYDAIAGPAYVHPDDEKKD